MSNRIEQSMLQAALSKCDCGGISFSLGLPAPEALASCDLGLISEHALAFTANSLQYQAPSRVLKESIVDLMRSRGVECFVDELVLTSGAQQGIALVARLLLARGYSAVAEDLTYPGFRQIIDAYGSSVQAVSVNPAVGINASSLNTVARSNGRRAFAYVIPDGHNPLGLSMSASDRDEFVFAAKALSVPIIEDASYGCLSYDGSSLLPLRARDREGVFYVGSFSKTVAPSLRTGWIIAPKQDVSPLEALKEAADVNTASIGQHIMHGFLTCRDFPVHIASISSAYKIRRDTMVRALHQYFPDDVRWQVPSTGFFIWIELPPHVDAELLLSVAVDQEGVSFMPGCAFRVGSSDAGSNGFRLSFSNCQITEIGEGIHRLGRVLGRW